ncbi:YciI family protein [Actinopolymorpha rutila]|uniref:YCII-related domain-containing protein n=1 Tax=Actinopolymorpha rutila TaxID=446787 RepID=A0A852Z7F7_9ACTN|nr:YciI family protein [Actinopolymorpha rutila]NYH88851.1 hypothetical protein [Actinopolymorpha rutila]
MPRFLTMIRIDENTLPGQEPDPGFEGRAAALFEEINKAGVMRETRGLFPTAEGTRLTWSEGKISSTDGPFTETKEVVGGYSITETRDKAEAVEWVRRFLEIHPKNWTVSAEVRQIEEG